MAAVAADLLYSSSFRGVVPSRLGHFWSGNFFRRMISTLVDFTEKLEAEGSMAAKSGSRVKVKVDSLFWG